jgi:hypothetical protein
LQQSLWKRSGSPRVKYAFLLRVGWQMKDVGYRILDVVKAQQQPRW